jgi:hypothetical protein
MITPFPKLTDKFTRGVVTVRVVAGRGAIGRGAP